MLTRLAVVILMMGAVLAAWQYGNQLGTSTRPSDAVSTGDDSMVLPRRPSADNIRALAPPTPAPRHQTAAPQTTPSNSRSVKKFVARESARPVEMTAPISAASLIPKARPSAATAPKKHSKWVSHLSGRDARFTVEEAKLRSAPCHGGFGANCAPPSDTGDLKVVGVMVETDEGAPVADKVLQGEVKSGSYYENTPVVYVK